MEENHPIWYAISLDRTVPSPFTALHHIIAFSPDASCTCATHSLSFSLKNKSEKALNLKGCILINVWGYTMTLPITATLFKTENEWQKTEPIPILLPRCQTGLANLRLNILLTFWWLHDNFLTGDDCFLLLPILNECLKPVWHTLPDKLTTLGIFCK